MPTTTASDGIEQELTQALDDLAAALQRAGEATATIKAMVPRLAATGSVLEQIEALVRAGRGEGGGGMDLGVPAPTKYTSPTLVVPAPPSARPRTAPRRQPESPAPERRAQASIHAVEQDAAPAVVAAPEAARPTRANVAAQVDSAPFPNPLEDPAVTCFRLEFESHPGPLDLRKVDDAVSKHPAVRDVALLDYDGRRATLKVWIVATSTPAEVQNALKRRALELFAPGHDISIVALENVA